MNASRLAIETILEGLKRAPLTQQERDDALRCSPPGVHIWPKGTAAGQKCECGSEPR